MIKQSLNARESSARVIYLMLLHRLLPVRTDLTGSITSMYRLSLNGEAISGLEEMGRFDSQQPILLCSVPNTIQLQTFEVWKEEELLRFSAPVGIWVPVSSLLDHLVSWLRLGKALGNVLLERSCCHQRIFYLMCRSICKHILFSETEESYLMKERWDIEVRFLNGPLANHMIYTYRGPHQHRI